MSEVIRTINAATKSNRLPSVGDDVFIQHSSVDGKIKKTTGEWSYVTAVYEDGSVRVPSGDIFQVKLEGDHFKSVN